MFKIKLAALVFILAINNLATGQITPTVKPDSAAMLRIVRKRIDSISKAIKTTFDYNSLAKLYVTRGIGEGILNHADSAINDYTLALTLNSKVVDIYVYRGSQYEKIKNYEKSIKDYQKALPYFEKTPDRASQLYGFIGFCQLKLKRYDQSLKSDSIALELNPNNAFAEANAGWVYLPTKRYEKAVEAFTKALVLSRTNNRKVIAEMVAGRADAKRMLKKYLDAINDYSQAIKLDPDNRKAHWNRAACYNNNGDYELADEEYTKTIGYFKGDKLSLAKLYDDRAWMELGEMKYQKALQDDSIALSYNDKYPDAYWHIAVAYAQNADFNQSIDAYQQFLGFYKDDKYTAAAVYDGIANEYYFLGKYDGVIKACNQAISLNDELWSSYITRGRAYLKMEKKDLARADFEKVVERDAVKGSYEYSFALFYTGLADKAIETMKLNVIATTNSVILTSHYYNLACLYSLMNKPDEAAAYLKKCIDGGYSKKYAIGDPDLENLRNSAQFKEVMGNK
jgi:tetratricopeptide (TPR) repeat protein